MADHQFLMMTARPGRELPCVSAVAGVVVVDVRLGPPATRTELRGLKGL